MIRVFLDANVLFSAAWRLKNGITQLWELKTLHLMSSHYALAEAERNLLRKRPEAMSRFNDLVRSLEVSSAYTMLDEGQDLPLKDQPILAAAIGSHCSVLLTGDMADFGHLIGTSVQGVHIITVATFLKDM